MSVVAAGIAIGERSRGGEGGGIEVAAQGPIVVTAVANAIRALRGARIQRGRLEENIEGIAAGQRHDAAQLPAAQVLVALQHR